MNRSVKGGRVNEPGGWLEPGSGPEHSGSGSFLFVVIRGETALRSQTPIVSGIIGRGEIPASRFAPGLEVLSKNSFSTVSLGCRSNPLVKIWIKNEIFARKYD